MTTTANTTFPLAPEHFCLHQTAPGKQLKLYHVYNSLSQTPYVSGLGIQSGNWNRYLFHPWHLTTPLSIGKHLDWGNTEPMNFISFFDNRQAAWAEAIRRQQSWTFQQQNVEIVVVSLECLDQENVFYFSVAELEEMLELSFTHPLRSRLNQKEWFVMEYVPEAAVIGLDS